MSTTSFPRRHALAVIAALAAPFVALSQTNPVPAAGPIPRQIIAAKRLFVSNAGVEGDGGEGPVRSPEYEGGPDRYYSQFYAAMLEWGRYELVGAPMDADLVAEVRVVIPTVERANVAHDPQLKLTLLDPTTHIALWSLTEHVDVSWRIASNERNFDQAVTRIVDRMKMLSLGSTMPPASAVAQRQRERRAGNVTAGAFLGAMAGAAIAGKSARDSQCDVFAGCDLSAAPNGSQAFQYVVSGAIVGGVLGWLMSAASP